MRTALRRIAALGAVVGLVGTLGVSTASSGAPLTNAKHFFWAQGQADPNGIVNSVSNDLIYHGGSAGTGAIGVETNPAVYLVWWGPEWAAGFQTSDTDGTLFSSKTLQTYLQSFFSNLGGSAWANVQTQYCSGALPGSTSCLGATGFIGNPKHQLKGVWVDPSPVPDDIVTLGLAQNLVDDPIAEEAIKASAHFGYDPTATYVILTGPKPIGTGEPVYCGYHSQTTSIDGLGNPYRLQYAFIPWQNTNWPGIGEGCGMHSVNATSDAFGNGVFDGWSIVTGHEYSEAATDPDNFFGVQDGWNDAQTSENGDKCAWLELQNITLAGHQFAVQPTWSNEAFDAGKDGCQVSR